MLKDTLKYTVRHMQNYETIYYNFILLKREYRILYMVEKALFLIKPKIRGFTIDENCGIYYIYLTKNNSILEICNIFNEELIGVLLGYWFASSQYKDFRYILTYTVNDNEIYSQKLLDLSVIKSIFRERNRISRILGKQITIKIIEINEY